MSEIEHTKNTINTSDEEEVYDEEIECMTDDEEEVAHDHIKCKKCGAMTHESVGKCSKCGFEFKFSASGYLIDGEDGGFICDDVEEEEDDMSESEDEPEYDSDMDSESDDDMTDSDDCEEGLYDDNADYSKDINIEEIKALPRRVTRSRSIISNKLKI